MTPRFRSRLLAALLAGVPLGCNGDSQPVRRDQRSHADLHRHARGRRVAVLRVHLTSGGTITASLASVTSAHDNMVMDAILELGIGFPAGTGCAVTTTKSVSPALTTQVLTSAEPGIHCVRAADVGDRNTPVKFAVRFAHP